MIPSNLRELVRTHVILAPGACGREGQSAGSGTILSRSAGSGDGTIFSRFRYEKQWKWKMSFQNVQNHMVFGCFCCRFFIFTVFYNDFGRIFTQKLLRRPSEAVEGWVSSGGALGGPGRVLGGSIYRKTPDQPPKRPLCYLVISSNI